MTTPILPPYIPPVGPVPAVTPLTFRDGLTFLNKLEIIGDYITKVLVPYVDESIFEFSTDMAESIVAIQDAVVAAQTAAAAAEAAAADIDTAIAAAVNDLTVQLNAAIAAAETAQSGAEDAQSAAETALAAALAAQTAAEAAQAAAEAVVAGLEPRVDALEAADAQFAIDLDEVDESVVPTALQVGRGGSFVNDSFAYLRAGLVNPSQDTRVVVTGSSTATGYNTMNDLLFGMYDRLAARAGVQSFGNLEAVVSAVGANGMQWFDGAVGGTTSANYINAARLASINLVAPHYVFHQVGSNDYANQVALATYKANIQANITNITAANVIHVLVHQQGRRDNTARPITWAQYGAALKEVAIANPTKAVFIDLSDGLDTSGIDNNNMGGLVLSDAIHMGGRGQAILAENLARQIGIPTARDVHPLKEIRQFTFLASATYDATVGLGPYDISDVLNPPASNILREIKIEGLAYNTPAAGGWYVSVQMRDQSDTVVEKWDYRCGNGTNGTMTMPFNARFIVPPFTQYKFVVSVYAASSAASTLYVSGSGSFTKGYWTAEAI